MKTTLRPFLDASIQLRDGAERRAILRAARRSSFRSPRVLLITAIIFVGAAAFPRIVYRDWMRQAPYAAPQILPGRGGSPRIVQPTHWRLIICSSLTSGLLCSAACYVMLRAVFPPFVRRAARQQGYDVCVRCGYWLRGLGNEVRQCPECGAKREPMLANGDKPEMLE
jgi:hypothetical protein